MSGEKRGIINLLLLFFALLSVAVFDCRVLDCSSIDRYRNTRGAF